MEFGEVLDGSPPIVHVRRAPSAGDVDAAPHVAARCRERTGIVSVMLGSRRDECSLRTSVPGRSTTYPRAINARFGGAVKPRPPIAEVPCSRVASAHVAAAGSKAQE